MQAFPTVQTLGQRTSWGEAVELAPGVTSLPAPQPASLVLGVALLRAPGVLALVCGPRRLDVSLPGPAHGIERSDCARHVRDPNTGERQVG